jgi:hypothetical protein
MKKLLILIVSLVFAVGTLSPAYAHGGGLDSQGGHNCRKGACAGTYHCHQPRGPECQKALGVKPKTSKNK